MGKRGDVESHRNKREENEAKKESNSKGDRENDRGKEKATQEREKKERPWSMVHGNQKRQGETDGKRNTTRKEGERRGGVKLAF